MLVIVFWNFSTAYSQILFKRTYGGVGQDNGRSVTMTYDGGYLLVGSTGTTGNGNSDGYLVKIDSVGNVLWSKVYGGSEIEWVNSVIQTSDSNIVMAGVTNSFGKGGYDVYLLKADSVGNFLWSKTFGGFDWDFGYSVVETSDGGLVVAGETYSFGSGNSDMYIIRTDKNGDSLWTKTYGGEEDESCLKAIETFTGELVLAGYTKSFGAGQKDFYIVNTNFSGDTLWTRTIGGTKNDASNDVIQTIDSQYTVVGYSSSFGNGSKDYSINKLKQNGEIAWSSNHNWVMGEDAISAIKEFPDGSYILAGTTTSYGGGKEDYHIQITYPNSGDIQVGKGPTFGDSENEIISDVFLTGGGGFIALGTTNGYGAGNNDFFVVKSDIFQFPDNAIINADYIEPIISEPVYIEEENKQGNLISIYPNPVHDKMIIETNDLHPPGLIEITHVLGGIVKSEVIRNSGKSIVDFSDLPRGVYFYTLSFDSEVLKTGKVIK